jgi:guanylate kinase
LHFPALKRMNKVIFLVDGASGTGKTDLLEYVTSPAVGAGVVLKATTRPMRDYERRERVLLDLDFCSRDVFHSMNLDYVYTYRKHQYGFSREQLAGLLDRRDRVFVTVRSIPTMRRLKHDFGRYKVVAIYVHSDIVRIIERLTAKHREATDIAARVATIEQTYEDYRANREFYDEFILNNSDRQRYYETIGQMIAKYS